MYKEIQHLATKLTNKKQLKNIIFKFDIITVHCFKHKWTQGGEGVRTTQANFQKSELHPPPLDFQPCASLALNMFFFLERSFDKSASSLSALLCWHYFDRVSFAFKWFSAFLSPQSLSDKCLAISQSF